MNEVKMIVRHTDNDGLCSGRVVYDALIKSGVEDAKIVGVPAGYADNGVITPILDKLKEVGKADIFLVDLSITKEELDQIPAGCNLLWIDHHTHSIEMMNAFTNEGATEVNEFLGLKLYQPCYQIGNMAIYASNRASAARLCWDVLFGGNAPYVVDLISDHDIFRHEMEDSIRFFNGTTLLDLRYLKSETWDKLVTHPDETFINKVITDGDLVMKVNKKVYSSIMRNAFEFKFRFERIDEKNACFIKSNTFSGIAVNSGYGNSFIFGDEYEKHDLAVVFRFTTNKDYSYTLYSAKHSFCVDIAEIFGGGGHPYAAGFIMPYNFFDKSEMTEEDDDKYCAIMNRPGTISFLLDEDKFDALVASGEITIEEKEET